METRVSREKIVRKVAVVGRHRSLVTFLLHFLLHLVKMKECFILVVIHLRSVLEGNDFVATIQPNWFIDVKRFLHVKPVKRIGNFDNFFHISLFQLTKLLTTPKFHPD